jgi:quinol monooxygenase YgiN
VLSWSLWWAIEKVGACGYFGVREFQWKAEMIVVTVKVDWGQETIQEILPELKKHVEVTLQEPGCEDFLFAIDVNNPDIVVATEVYKDYPAHEDHFKTAQWGHFSGIMEKYPPRSIDVKTYDASETRHALDD